MENREENELIERREILINERNKLNTMIIKLDNKITEITEIIESKCVHDYRLDNTMWGERTWYCIKCNHIR